MMNKKLNDVIEMSLILDGVAWKADDFAEEEVIKVIRRRPHTRAEKIRNDNLHRVKITGKKHDRTRDDYNNYKDLCDSMRDYRYMERGRGCHGDYKDHIDDLKVADALKNEVDDFEYLKAEAERIERVKVEIRQRTEERIRRLRDESLEMLRRAKALLADAEGNWSEADRLERSLTE